MRGWVFTPLVSLDTVALQRVTHLSNNSFSSHSPFPYAFKFYSVQTTRADQRVFLNESVSIRRSSFRLLRLRGIPSLSVGQFRHRS